MSDLKKVKHSILCERKMRKKNNKKTRLDPTETVTR